MPKPKKNPTGNPLHAIRLTPEVFNIIYKANPKKTCLSDALNKYADQIKPAAKTNQ